MLPTCSNITTNTSRASTVYKKKKKTKTEKAYQHSISRDIGKAHACGLILFL